MTDQSQRVYHAIAIIQGILSLDGTHPVVTIGDADFPAYASKVVLRKHQPGQAQNFKVYPCIRHKQAAFQLVNVVDLQPTAITLNGCWELHKGVPHFAIYRNGVLNPGDRFCRNLVPVVWADAPPTDGQFWQAEAQVRDGAFVITKADGPFMPPPKATPSVSESSRDEASPAIPKPKLIGLIAQSSEKPALTQSLAVEEIRSRATPAEIQVICKLNQVPELWELPDKRVVCYLKDGESDLLFTVQITPKVFKELTAHKFADGVATLTGEIGTPNETGFELLNAAVQVFEKRACSESDAHSGANKTGVPKKPPAYVKPRSRKDNASRATAVKQQALLDRVKLK